MSEEQVVTTEEQKTFAQLIEGIGDTSFTKSLKSWLEKHQKSIDEVVDCQFRSDAIDVTEDSKDFKKYIAGPYIRAKLIFKDGTVKCGKSLVYNEWDIKDDVAENWGYEWVRQEREEKTSND